MHNIAIEEVDKGMDLIGKLYKECFGENLKKPHDDVAFEDIIHTFFWM